MLEVWRHILEMLRRSRRNNYTKERQREAEREEEGKQRKREKERERESARGRAQIEVARFYLTSSHGKHIFWV